MAFQLDSLLHRIDALHFPIFLKQVCHKTLPFSEGFIIKLVDWTVVILCFCLQVVLDSQ